MKLSTLALASAVAGALSAGIAFAQTSGQQAAYDYGSYYAQEDSAKSPSDKPKAQPAPEAPAAAPCETCNSCDSCECKKHCCKWEPIIKIEECCPLKCEDQEICRLFDCCTLKNMDTTVTGWVNGGIMGNGRDTADNYNGPLTFPDRNGEGQLNQLWLAVERTAPKDNCGLFVGGRFDLMWGSDYFFTTAAGLDGTADGNTPRWGRDNFQYGAALPQAYVETAFNDDVKVKWGHFFTIIGYEVVPAIGNFFYSHAYTMQYGEPFTHTGILASKALEENWTVYAGAVNGWDTFNADSRANFLGGLTYADSDWGSLAFSIVAGDNPTSGFAGTDPFSNRTMYSVVWTRNFTSRLTYVFQHDLGVQNDAQTASGTDGQAEWYGINQYLFYKLNCCWTAGARFEWFRDDDGYRVTGLRPGNAIAGASFPGNFYEATVGLNYKANANLQIRPEVRYDWYEGADNQNGGVAVTSPFDAGNSNNQFTFGIDAIYQY